MQKSDLKRAVRALQPDRGMEYRLEEAVTRTPRRKFSYRYAAAFAAVGLAAVLCVGLLTGLPAGGQSARGVTIAKVELPAGGGKVTAKMMPLIVYKGRIYLLSPAQLDAQGAKALLGDKLGTTTGGLTEWSDKGDYVNFSSTIGVTDVYAVKGYDTSFRLMTNETLDGVAYPQIFECLNGMNVRTGKDVFGLFKIKGNVASSSYELFESWNNGKGELHSLENADALDAFVDALYKAEPIAMDPAVWDDQSPDAQKFLTLTLKDSTQVVLRLFKNGTVYYGGLEALFKIEPQAFGALWGQMN